VVTNFAGEGTTLYQNLGRGFFIDGSSPAGILAASRSLLGFGVGFLDYNRDAWIDLVTANGHVSDVRPEAPFGMPLQLLAGVEGGQFLDVSRLGGPEFTTPRVGRGLVYGDLDNDGRTDLLLVSHDAPLGYLHNETNGGHFLTIELEGTRSPRMAVGAQVSVLAGGRRLVSWRSGGGSFQSASDPRLHFGLGDAERIERIEVVWPSGRIDSHLDLLADRGYRLREGQAGVTPLPGFDPPKGGPTEVDR